MVAKFLFSLFLFVFVMFTFINVSKIICRDRNGVPCLNFVMQSIGIVGIITELIFFKSCLFWKEK